MSPLAALALAAALVGGPAAGEPPPEPDPIVSRGAEVRLSEHLRREGTTLFVFVNGTSAIEREFLDRLTGVLPRHDRLALRVVELPGLDAPAARQHEIRMTPTVLVLDRFGRELTRTNEPEEIRRAVSRGLRMARIKWVDELDPEAPEVYGARPEQLRRGIAGIVKTMSLRADVMQMFRILSEIHFSDGYLNRREHELIAAYVSALNHCKF